MTYLNEGSRSLSTRPAPETTFIATSTVVTANVTPSDTGNQAPSGDIHTTPLTVVPAPEPFDNSGAVDPDADPQAALRLHKYWAVKLEGDGDGNGHEDLYVSVTGLAANTRATLALVAAVELLTVAVRGDS